MAAGEPFDSIGAMNESLPRKAPRRLIGTVEWELDIPYHHGPDPKHGHRSRGIGPGGKGATAAAPRGGGLGK